MKTSFLANAQRFKISPKEILLKYLNFLPLFIICIVSSITIAFLYLKYKTPIYNSSISIFLPEGNKPGGGTNGGDMTGLNEIMLYSNKVNLSNEIQIIRTKTVMARVVDKLKLNLQYYKLKQIGQREIYNPTTVRAVITAIKDSSRGESVEVRKIDNKLFHINGEQKTQILDDADIKGSNITFHIAIDPKSLKNDEGYLITWNPVLEVAGNLAGSLEVNQPQSDANILNLSITTEVPEKGKDILNTLVKEYNERNNDQKNRLVDYTLQFIDERMNLMRGELGKVEGSLQSFRQSQEIISPELQGTSGLEELAMAKSNVDNSEVKLNVIKMVKQAISSQNQPISTLGIDDASLSALVQQYNQYYFTKEEQLKSMPAANPAVRVTQSQLDKLKSSILDGLENIGSSTDNLKNRYVGDYQSSRAKLRAVPMQERRLLEIGRQQDIKEKLFMFLLQKKEEAAITKASGLSLNSTPLDEAETIGLITPISGTIYRNAIIAALLIPVLLIYLRDLLNDKIITRTDIIAKTNTPIIGEIAHNADKNNKRLVVSFVDRTVIGEQFRILRANIPILTKGQNKKVILITSTTPAEGKTFCSLNLGAVYAIAGKKTVIVEMDLRKPKVAHSLNLPSTLKGITHFVSDQAFLEELPTAIPEYPNLFVVTAGIVPPNPSEILMDEKMDLLFDYLKTNFDFVIIDSAPLGLVVDAKLLARHCDATIFVVRQRKTAKKQLLQVDDLYEEGIFPNFSLLVNDVKTSGVNSYYTYGGNYMSTYKYSYGNEPKSMWQRARTMIGL